MPDQVHTTSTPPTWRAKDVGGNRLPGTPMGTEPLTGSAGGGGCTKSGSRRCTQGILPSFGPQGCVKPYCCFVDCIVFLLGARGATVHSSRWRDRAWRWVSSPSYVRMGPPFICSRGYPQVAA